MKVADNDEIRIDGQPCQPSTRRLAPSRVIGIHKPADVVCTRDDPEGRATLFDLLPASNRRWVMVGRLDLTTSGLVLFTDDGELAHRLTHPSFEVSRRYAVRVLGTPTPEDLRVMQRGVELDGEMLKFDRVMAAGGDGANRWFDCLLHTGRNREVRRLWESRGFAVSRLMRTSYGPVALPREVRPGKWFDVTGEALIRLYEAVGLASPATEEAPRARLSGTQLRGSSRRRQRVESEVPARRELGVKKRAQDRKAPIAYVTREERPGQRRERAAEGGMGERPRRPRPEGGMGERPRRPRPEDGMGERPRRPRPEGGMEERPRRPRPEGGTGERQQGRQRFEQSDGPRRAGTGGGRSDAPRRPSRRPDAAPYGERCERTGDRPSYGDAPRRSGPGAAERPRRSGDGPRRQTAGRATPANREPRADVWGAKPRGERAANGPARKTPVPGREASPSRPAGPWAGKSAAPKPRGDSRPSTRRGPPAGGRPPRRPPGRPSN